MHPVYGLLEEAKNCKFYFELAQQVKMSNIKIIRWMSKSVGGARYDRKIRIPKPTNEDRLSVGFHEIGHILLGHCEYCPCKEPEYLQEFDACRMEEYLCEQYKVETDKIYARNRIYVLRKIADAINQKIVTIDTLPKHIVNFFYDVDFDTWRGAKIKVYRDREYESEEIYIKKSGDNIFRKI